jgi:hypothetical protein
MATKTCNIAESVFTPGEDGAPGLWAVRADVKVGDNRYSTTHVIEGAEGWTDAQLSAEVIKLY